MSISRSLPVAALIVACSTAAVSAADITFQEPASPEAAVAAPAYGWTGFYVGGQVGGAFGGDVNDLLLDNNVDGRFNQPDDGIDRLFGDSDDGFIGGVHAGYDHQAGNFLLGGVIDASFLDISETRGVTTLAGNTTTVTREIDFLATARVRAGFAAERFMLYGTGGLAYARVEQNFFPARVVGLTPTSVADEDEFGYTVGAGAEFLARRDLSFGVEYLYTDIGSDDSRGELVDAAGIVRSAGRLDDDVDFHTVWAKASYRFN